MSSTSLPYLESALKDARHIAVAFSDSNSSPFPPLYSIRNMDSIPFITRVHLAHLLLHKFGMDWPYVLTSDSDPRYPTTIPNASITPPDQCPDCGGLIYSSPILTPNLIKDIITPLNLRLALCFFCTPAHCKLTATRIRAFSGSPNKHEQSLAGLFRTHTLQYSEFSDPDQFSAIQKELLNSPPLQVLVKRTYNPEIRYWREPWAQTVTTEDGASHHQGASN